MLVLTRKPEHGDESIIIIGDAVQIKVVAVKGDQVRLGITAPDEIAVWRREIWDEKQDEKDKPNR